MSPGCPQNAGPSTVVVDSDVLKDPRPVADHVVTCGRAPSSASLGRSGRNRIEPVHGLPAANIRSNLEIVDFCPRIAPATD